MALPHYASPVDRIIYRAVRAICALVFLFLVLPILVVLPLSFNAEPFVSFPIQGWSLKWYAVLFEGADWRRGAINTAIVAANATILATVLGTCAALGLGRGRLPFRTAIIAIFLSPMIVPLVVTAISLYFFFAKVNLVGTLTGLVLGHTVIATPFVLIAVLSTLAGFDSTLVKAAVSLGAGPLRTFFKITLPLILPGILTGALFAFATSLDEIVIALFIAGPEQHTLPRVMWKVVRQEITPEILSIACLLVLLSLALLMSIEALRRRTLRIRGIQP
jgi:putative spermidine/putrescine transport system permease protein